MSDEDYLSDLNRSLEIDQATHPQRRGGVRYSDQNQYFDAYLNGYQTIAERIADVNKPYNLLPKVLYAGTTEVGALRRASVLVLLVLSG